MFFFFFFFFYIYISFRLMLLRIRSAHLEILKFPVGVAYKYRDIFVWFKTMRRQQILASALGIQKVNLE